jgi:hypothetical protein
VLGGLPLGLPPVELGLLLLVPFLGFLLDFLPDFVFVLPFIVPEEFPVIVPEVPV